MKSEEEEAVRACKGWAVKELLFGEEEIDQISARDLLPSPKWCPSCLDSTSDLACKLGREILLLSSLEELLSPLGSAVVSFRSCWRREQAAGDESLLLGREIAS